MSDNPGFVVPPLACDSHMHVFGPLDRYPPAAQRGYTPAPAPLARYRAMATALGLQRTVLVQPSAYGTDNACMLDALRILPEALRGIAVIDETTPESALDDMHRLGVRGVRLNLISRGIPADQVADTLRATAARVAPRGWHVQIFVSPQAVQELAPVIRDIPVPVVVDHMGHVDASLGVNQPGLNALRDLLAGGHCWAKLSGANRVSREETGFRDALPIMRALVAANPDHLVWGSDWPHIGQSTPDTVIYNPYDNTDLLRLLGEATPDDATRHRILVANPAKLYGWK